MTTRKKTDVHGLDALFDAIVASDFASVHSILESAPELVASTVGADRLIAAIPHWLYVGDTPLHLAAAALQYRVVDLLILRGADPASVNRRRATPLHYACDPRPRSGSVWNPEDQVLIIDRLVQAGAAVDVSDDGGATPLHRAVRARSVAAVQRLLKHGADASAALRTSGSTPLHLAATASGASGTADTSREQLDIIEALVASGADPERPDARGRSAASAARSAGVRQAMLRHVR